MEKHIDIINNIWIELLITLITCDNIIDNIFSFPRISKYYTYAILFSVTLRWTVHFNL